jgi:protein-S-isoprenylcysteine O-methyltransferase Ste14
MDSSSAERATARRAPRARSFVLVGVVLGSIGTLVVSSLFPPDPELGQALVSGYFLLWGVLIGLVGGLLAWLWADHRSKKRVTDVEIQRLGPDDEPQD